MRHLLCHLLREEHLITSASAPPQVPADQQDDYGYVKLLSANSFMQTHAYGGPPTFVSPNFGVFFQFPQGMNNSYWALKSQDGSQELNFGYDIASLQKVLKNIQSASKEQPTVKPATGLHLPDISPATITVENNIETSLTKGWNGKVEPVKYYDLSDDSAIWLATTSDKWVYHDGKTNTIYGVGQAGLDAEVAKHKPSPASPTILYLPDISPAKIDGVQDTNTNLTDNAKDGDEPTKYYVLNNGATLWLATTSDHWVYSPPYGKGDMIWSTGQAKLDAIFEKEKPISSDFLADTEGFTYTTSKWLGDDADRYWKGGTSMSPMYSVCVGTGTSNFNKWQIYQGAKGVVASGDGQSSFSLAIAKYEHSLIDSSSTDAAANAAASYKEVLAKHGFVPPDNYSDNLKLIYYTHAPSGGQVTLAWDDITNKYVWDYAPKDGMISQLGKTPKQLDYYLNGYGVLADEPEEQTPVVPPPNFPIKSKGTSTLSSAQTHKGDSEPCIIYTFDGAGSLYAGQNTGTWVYYDFNSKKTIGHGQEQLNALLGSTPTNQPETSPPTNQPTSSSSIKPNISQAIQKLVALGKNRGYLTYDDVNEMLPHNQMSPDQIEGVMKALSDHGIEIVDSMEIGAHEPTALAGSAVANEILNNLNAHAISVNGDEWNKVLAVTLENDYVRSRPKIEQLIKESLGDQTDSLDGDEDEDNYSSPTEWDELSGGQQEEAEQAWKSYYYDNYYDSEVENWQENNEEEVVNQIVYDFDHGNETDWAEDAIQEFIDGYGKEDDPVGMAGGSMWAPGNRTGLPPPIPYTADELLGMMSLADDSGDVELDIPPLPDNSDPRQMTLPGIPPPDRVIGQEEPEWVDALKKVISDAFETRVEYVRNHMEPPEYLSTSANESLDDSWGQMDDDEKFEYAKNHLDIEDAPNGSGSGSGEIFDQLPKKFDPLNLTTGKDYRRTQQFARHISLKRSAQILVERSLVEPAIAQSAVAGMDSTLWKAWVDSSTTPEGLALQVATAEELGGRLRLEPDQKRQSIAFANDKFARIGGYEGVKAMIRAKWETSQYMLDQAGHHVLNLYRSITLDDLDKAQKIKVSEHEKLPEIVVLRNGAASTSISRSMANNWKGGTNSTVILRLEVPRTAAISVPAYGQNIHKEQEVVVAGTAWSRWDAWHRHAPDFESVPLMENRYVSGLQLMEDISRPIIVDLFAMGVATGWLSAHPRHGPNIAAIRARHRARHLKNLKKMRNQKKSKRPVFSLLHRH